MATRKFPLAGEDTGNWSGECSLLTGAPSAGLVLRDVKHDNFSLARDMRVVRVWIGEDQSRPENWVSMRLGASNLPAIEDKIAVDAVDDPKDPNKAPPLELLAPYPRAREFSAKFNTPGAVLGDPASGDSQPLFITQRYLFTRYSLTPFHEPLGVLTAARVYPLLQFRYDARNVKERRRPRILRVDYRLEFALEPQVKMTDLVGRSFKPKSREGFNQASIILDPDTRPTAFSDLFAAAEKPLPTEAIGQGLRHGDKADWDNVHVWGALVGLLPSTPGVTHGCHLHWRWGAFMLVPGSGAVTVKGGPQFGRPAAGLVQSGAGLVDWRISDQSLRFAITGDANRNATGAWRASAGPSERVFDDLFTSEQPSLIKDGAPSIVIWLSFTIFRQQSDTLWDGTVMLPGIYFAHDPENTPIALGLGGSTEEMHKPGSVSGSFGWIRP